MYVYKQSEFGEFALWTVGFYDPLTGKWVPESDHNNPDDAAWRVHWLNGGEHQSNPNHLSESSKWYFEQRAKGKK